MAADRSDSDRQKLSLDEAAARLLQECRVVLPGIQALFGFQLIVTFESRFQVALTRAEQRLHLAALGLVTLAIACVMTPASYHSLSGERQVTSRFIRTSTAMLLIGMPLLAAAICIDFYVVAGTIVAARVAAGIAGALFASFAALWFVLPLVRRRRP